jgi:hypothetical protein
MAHLNQLRRAIAYALDHGWRRDRTEWNRLYRTWPLGKVRAIEIVMSDTIRPRLVTVRELDMMDCRKVSIRRAITVLRAEYDEHGEPLA